jgi:integrase
MVRTLSDCGLRAGELLALERRDLDVKASALRVERTVALGEVLDGTKVDHGEQDAGRTIPVPPGLLALLTALPRRIDTPLLFPSPKGRTWLYQTWWAQVWVPGREASGMDPRPHELRHSWISLLRAAGVDHADLADAAGHSEATATARYSHGLGKSFDDIRKAVGE